jgi:hypothetical protein
VDLKTMDSENVNSDRLQVMLVVHCLFIDF